MKTWIKITLIALILHGACTDKSQKNTKTLNNEEMEKQAKQEIETILAKYEEVLNTSNATAAVALYTQDGVFMPSNAPSARGSENIQAAYEFVFSNIQLNIKFFIDEIVIDQDIAYAVTGSKGTTLIHASGETVPEENRELFVFEIENGKWKIARYMFNKTNSTL
ncbi:YybH family protein [Poritiphilus flavus]|uniref:SgcJ/EcaC family oxidoreductase n=1 Tax=Poritiphilus flavus TaxID=2697053 RepID=A0A6L9E7S4_9FLAO|nr:SgcJ/EcaC family oxidoreductase [Poritiphilus flavus]NAS10658.1 SgcJ/EcaC family oxidoreductase [Poritiphilus flavus]